MTGTGEIFDYDAELRRHNERLRADARPRPSARCRREPGQRQLPSSRRPGPPVHTRPLRQLYQPVRHDVLHRPGRFVQQHRACAAPRGTPGCAGLAEPRAKRVVQGNRPGIRRYRRIARFRRGPDPVRSPIRTPRKTSWRQRASRKTTSPSGTSLSTTALTAAPPTTTCCGYRQNHCPQWHLIRLIR